MYASRTRKEKFSGDDENCLCRVGSTRGPCPWTVFTVVQNDTRVHRPCWRAVSTGIAYNTEHPCSRAVLAKSVVRQYFLPTQALAVRASSSTGNHMLEVEPNGQPGRMATSGQNVTEADKKLYVWAITRRPSETEPTSAKLNGNYRAYVNTEIIFPGAIT